MNTNFFKMKEKNLKNLNQLTRKYYFAILFNIKIHELIQIFF